MPMISCLLPNHDFNLHLILFRSFIRELLFFVENSKKNGKNFLLNKEAQLNIFYQ